MTPLSRRFSRQIDGPGGSLTDQAAMAAFEAIDERLREAGIDPNRSWSVVMVMVPDGRPTNATVAGSLPNGEVATDALLEHAVRQLAVIAAECGLTIELTPARN